ncbi:hypothetical protein RLOatenuis_1970 [Rickettsiales bacterium]|nr:hypothetical protein RLOatenuis_1970 [Rickettsiales bacterium]
MLHNNFNNLDNYHLTYYDLNNLDNYHLTYYDEFISLNEPYFVRTDDTFYSYGYRFEADDKLYAYAHNEPYMVYMNITLISTDPHYYAAIVEFYPRYID